MKTIFRPAVMEDATAFQAIKKQLQLKTGASSPHREGFLLGSSVAKYEELVEKALVISVVKEDRVVGFSIVLPDNILRGSELWAKRKLIQTDFPLEALEKRRLAYYDQMAILPGHRLAALPLAMKSAREAFTIGHDVILTTTVLEPVENRAVVPFLEGAGARRLGRISEVYPGVGPILSQLWILKKKDWQVRTTHKAYRRWVESI